MKQYYVRINGEQLGPMDIKELSTMDIAEDTYIWYEGLPRWIFASQAPDLSFLFDIPKKSPPQPPIFTEEVETEQKTKQKMGKKLKYTLFAVGAIIISVIIIWIIDIATFKPENPQDVEMILDDLRQTDEAQEEEERLRKLAEEEKEYQRRRAYIEELNRLNNIKDKLEAKIARQENELFTIINRYEEAQNMLKNVREFKLFRPYRERLQQEQEALERVDNIVGERRQVERIILDLREELNTIERRIEEFKNNNR